MNSKTTIITNDKCWMEHTALTQLESVSNLPGVVRAVGLPDLHAGKSPVGITVESEGVLYPHLIGNDIGCGMGLFETNCSLRKFKQERFVTKLNHIRALEDLPCSNPYPEVSPIYDLGTIGGGNHFAEFQQVEEIIDQTSFDALGIDTSQLLLLVHSGSRGYGQRILSEFLDFTGLSADSERTNAYLAKHDDALLWAQRNRRLVAEKLIDYLGYDSEVKALLDCHHNFLERQGDIFIHRKGAVSALHGRSSSPAPGAASPISSSPRRTRSCRPIPSPTGRGANGRGRCANPEFGTNTTGTASGNPSWAAGPSATTRSCSTRRRPRPTRASSMSSPRCWSTASAG